MNSRKTKDQLARRLAAISHTLQQANGSLPQKSSAHRQKSRDPRIQTFKPAKVFTGRNTSIPCIVLNVSVGGVRIAVDGAVDLPGDVILKFDRTGETRSARVVWQDRNEYGLSYRMLNWQTASPISNTRAFGRRDASDLCRER